MCLGCAGGSLCRVPASPGTVLAHHVPRVVPGGRYSMHTRRCSAPRPPLLLVSPGAAPLDMTLLSFRSCRPRTPRRALVPTDSHAGRQPDLELLVCVADTGGVAGFLGCGLASWSERNRMWYLLPRPRGSPVHSCMSGHLGSGRALCRTSCGNWELHRGAVSLLLGTTS